jgi:hypothetical protein
LLPGADAWLATVRRLRPARSWDEVTEAVNTALSSDQPAFTRERLVRSVRLLMREELAEPALLDRAPRCVACTQKTKNWLSAASASVDRAIFIWSDTAQPNGNHLSSGSLIFVCCWGDELLAIEVHYLFNQYARAPESALSPKE